MNKLGLEVDIVMLSPSNVRLLSLLETLALSKMSFIYDTLVFKAVTRLFPRHNGWVTMHVLFAFFYLNRINTPSL